MYKEQLMELHQFFIYLCNEMLPEDYECEYIKIYHQLDIRPHHIHKLKTEQKAAIFLLSACLANYIGKEDEKSKNLSNKLCKNAIKCIVPKNKKIKQALEKLKEEDIHNNNGTI